MLSIVFRCFILVERINLIISFGLLKTGNDHAKNSALGYLGGVEIRA